MQCVYTACIVCGVNGVCAMYVVRITCESAQIHNYLEYEFSRIQIVELEEEFEL